MNGFKEKMSIILEHTTVLDIYCEVMLCSEVIATSNIDVGKSGLGELQAWMV